MRRGFNPSANACNSTPPVSSLDPMSAQRLALLVILCTLSRHACSSSHSVRRATMCAIASVDGVCVRMAACATVLSVNDMMSLTPTTGVKLTSPHM